MPKPITMESLMRIAVSGLLMASAAVAPSLAMAGETRASAAMPKAGYVSTGKDKGETSQSPRRGPPGGFPDNRGQDRACERANENAPNHCRNDSNG